MTRRRATALLLASALALAVTATGCGDDDDSSGATKRTTTSSTSSSSTSTSSTTAFVGATTPTSIASHASKTALLTDVAVGDGVVTFTFRSDLPGIDVRFVDPPVTQDGSGKEVDVDGDAFLHVRMEPASAVDLSKDPFEETYRGPDRLRGSGPITEVVKTGDFEANLSWVIGLASVRPYRVEAADSTVRVYIST